MSGQVSVQNTVDTGHDDMIVSSIKYYVNLFVSSAVWCNVSPAYHSMMLRWTTMGRDWLPVLPTGQSKFLRLSTIHRTW